MRICHLSDTHGEFPYLKGNFDVIVHSGDFFPNDFYHKIGDMEGEQHFQKKWLKDRLSTIEEWCQGKPFLFTLGNHDFVDAKWMEATLIKRGINAHHLHQRIVSCRDINFYGFPFVPSINGTYNFERTIPQMQVEVDVMVKVLNSKDVDVIVAHSAMHGTLDDPQSHYGSTVIGNAMDYQVVNLPFAYLHGHIHSDYGVTIRNEVLVSNAATTQNIIKI